MNDLVVQSQPDVPPRVSTSRRKRRETGTGQRSESRGRAAVIGTGFGGLAAAIRLQTMGFETVCFEARDQPGGRRLRLSRPGFHIRCRSDRHHRSTLSAGAV